MNIYDIRLSDEQLETLKNLFDDFSDTEEEAALFKMLDSAVSSSAEEPVLNDFTK